NWVENNDNNAVPAAGFADMDATGIAPEYKDSPWRGKLKIPLMPTPDEPVLGAMITRVLTDSGFPDSGDWYRDFECDFRSSLAKAQVGADQVDPTPMECSVNSVGATQQPHLPTDTWTAHHSNNVDVGTGIYMMEQTPNVQFGSVYEVTWWGIWRDSVGTSCDPPANVEFEIATYAGPGGTEIALETVAPVETVLDEYSYGGASLYKYNYAFDEDVLFRDQYISIRAIVVLADNCFFHWISSPDGDDAAATVDEDGDALPPPSPSANLSLCISEYTVGGDCSGGSTFAQPPVHPITPGPPASESTDLTPIYERVVTGSGIGLIEFWGIWLTDEAIPAPCTPPSNVEIQVRYVDSPTLSAASTVVTAPGRLLTPGAADLTDHFTAPNGDPAPLYRYAFAPDVGISVSDGWLSVQQKGVAADPALHGCRFHWVQSALGANQAVRWKEGDSSAVDQNVNMSLCFGSTPVASITGCSASPAILGKDMTGTFTMFGENLMMVDTVLLVPEKAQFGVAGNAVDMSRHVDLFSSSVLEAVTFGGELGTSLEISVHFSGPFNTAADGATPICTDGRAVFVPIISGMPDGTTCNMLLDTIEPHLVVFNYTNPSDADTGSPRITAN
ncbi:MAG: hypothetical protein KAH38_02135, partial [Candidatus Hydrogenedentes bacterium]|nr:hypothetical protein [Candidatus Hydrogenedentota bacterium]